MTLDEEERLFRKLALPIVAGITIILLILRFTKLDDGDSVSNVISNVIDNSIAALIAAIGVTLFIFYLNRKHSHTTTYFARGDQLRKHLWEDADASPTWKIRARTGSYFVREILPRLSSGAIIDVVLMDPSRSEDMATYQALRPANEQPNWDPLRIQADIIVSIIRLLQTTAAKQLMRVSLYTTGTAWAQSLDISNKNSFLCGQAKGDLALVCPESDEFYSRFVDDFVVVSRSAQHRPLPKIADAGNPVTPLADSDLAKFQPIIQTWFGIDISLPPISTRIVERSAGGHNY